MMEYKFRGKCVKTGKWIYGYYAKTPLTDNAITLGDCRIHDLIIVDGNYFNVEEESVGQYTGLKDKNGKEIYERDVLSYKAVIYTDCSKTEVEKIHDEALIGIINHSSIATIVIPYTKNVPAFGHDVENNEKLILDLNSKEIEIIGNIYDNQELLQTIKSEF